MTARWGELKGEGVVTVLLDFGWIMRVGRMVPESRRVAGQARGSGLFYLYNFHSRDEWNPVVVCECIFRSGEAGKWMITNYAKFGSKEEKLVQ